MISVDVPFVLNPDDRCVPATMGMVLAHFLPNKQYDMAELETFAGYKKGKGTWRAQSMLNFQKLGFQTAWIEDFDIHAFVKDQAQYLATILDPQSLAWQIEHSDLKAEAQRIQKYLDNDGIIQQRKGTRQDIESFMNDGWLVSLEVNANRLADKPGYEGHSILVVGFDNNKVEIHNPDGVNGNRESQEVSWDQLKKAWREFGGSYSMYAFKKSPESSR